MYISKDSCSKSSQQDTGNVCKFRFFYLIMARAGELVIILGTCLAELPVLRALAIIIGDRDTFSSCKKLVLFCMFHLPYLGTFVFRTLPKKLNEIGLLVPEIFNLPIVYLTVFAKGIFKPGLKKFRITSSQK